MSNNSTHVDDYPSPINDHTSFVPAPLWMRIVAICLTSTTATFGCIGNSAMLLAFALNRSLWTKQNIYVLCLSASDLLVTTYPNIQDLVQFVLGYWPYSRLYCRIHLTAVYLTYVLSLNLVVLISRDRMLMVIKGANYASYESARQKWIFAILNVFYVLFGLFFWANYDLVSSGTSIFVKTGRCRPEQQQNLYVTIFHQVVFAVLPGMMMLYYYAYVRRYVRNKIHTSGVATKTITQGGSVQMQPPSANVQPATSIQVWKAKNTPAGIGGNSNDNFEHAVRTMNLLILCALCFTVPFTSLSLVMNVLIGSPTLVTPATYEWWSRLYELTFFVCFVHGAVNPFLYAYAMPTYRKAVRNVSVRLWDLAACRKNLSVHS